MISIAIYMACFGGYDDIEITQPLECEKYNLKYFFISDDPNIEVPVGWELILSKKKFVSNAEANRYYKINGHILFESFDFTLYLDSNISIINSLEGFFSKINLEREIDFLAFKHPYRKFLSKEIKACLYHDKIDLFNYLKARKQVINYYNLGLKYDVFFEANILLRDNRSPKVKLAMLDWFEEYQNGIKRDQLSLNYILNKNSIIFSSLSKYSNREKFFKINKHKAKLNLFGKITLKIKRIIYRLFIGKLV